MSKQFENLMMWKFENAIRLLFVFALLVNSPNCFAQNSITLGEDKAMKAVEALPEIKKLVHSFRPKDTTARITLMIGKDPDSSFKYFWVQVGVSDPYLFTTLHNFYVTPSTYEVRYLDTISDSLLTLKQWRVRNAHKK